MADVDLIPADYAKDRLVRRRVKLFALACVSVAVLVGAARAGLEVALSRENREVTDLKEQGALLARSKSEAEAFRLQKQRAEKQLTELDELRGSDRLRMLLHALDAAWSDSIWLNELRLVRRDRPAGGNTGVLTGGGVPIIVVPKPGAEPLQEPLAAGAQRVEIRGHAVNHSRLAEFMRGLAEQPGIAGVSLLDTGLGSHANRPVIDLTLLLLVDGTSRKPPQP